MDDLEKDIDKLYSQLGEYIDDFEFQNYILPLLDPNTFTEDKVENLIKLVEFYKEEGIYLPLPDDPRYEHIKDYNDYEYTYCIAYEMVIRTDKFYELTKYYPYKKDTKWIKEIVELGLNPSIDVFPTDMIILDENYKFRLLYQSKKHIIVDDFNNGLYLLIEYYLDKEKIYQIDNSLQLKKITLNNFKDEKYIFLNKIFKNYEKYYISIIDPLDNQDKFIPLSKDININKLDINFIRSIEDKYIKYKNIETEPAYSRPTLNFKNSKIINLPININLSQTEIEAYVSKIKEDYDKRESIIQTPMELLGIKIDKAVEPNSLKEMPSTSDDKRRQAFAHAFCVYDLYKVLHPVFKKKSKAFKEKRKNGTIEKNTSNPYDTEGLKVEVAFIVGLFTKDGNPAIDKVGYYYRLMNDYITKGKYKELISGISS